MSMLRHRMTEADYLRFSESSVDKHEFINGEVYAMAGGSPLHAAVAANAIVALKLALGARGCTTFTSDLRVHIPDTGSYVYPDVTVACGPQEYTHGSLRTPTFLVEVLSPGTAADDRGAKWAHYRRIPSLLAYMMVDPALPVVELYFRAPGADLWQYTAHEDRQGTIRIPPLDLVLEMAALLDGTAGLQG